MKKGIIYNAIVNRKITLFLVALIAIFGIYSFYITPKQEAPDITAPYCLITTVYPGASPEDIEELVTKKIEDVAVEIEGYDMVESQSKDSLSIVVLRLDIDADIDKAWTDLRQKLDDLQSRLPDGCNDIEINTNLDETAGMIIAMSGDNYTYEELAGYAEELKGELSRVSGISRFDLVGKLEKEVKVEVDAKKLNEYKVSLDDIVKIIGAQNVEIPSGQISDGDSKINVNIKGSFSDIEEIKETVILVSSENGAQVKLKDIAKVYMGLEDSSFKIKQNGKNAVLLTGYFKANTNILISGKDVEAAIENFSKELPTDIIFDKVLFQPEDVGNSINEFMINLIEGILFVIAVVFIGMGGRNAATVSLAIPLSMLITFAAMKLIGIDIHQMSITALIIALGMLVDNAIVLSDAIQVRIDNDEEKILACVNGVKEVAIPVLTSTLTTVGAFIPLLMLPSAAGEYIKSIPQIIMISLSASYFVALFVTPVIAFMIFKKTNKKEKDSKIRKVFERLLHFGMKKKKLTLSLALLSLVFSLFIASKLGMQFFPKSDKNIVYININTEQSGNIDKTEKIVEQASMILKEQKEILSYTAAIGDGLPKFYTTIPVSTQSQDFAQIMLRLDLKKDERFKTNSEFVDFLQGQFDSTIVGGTAIVKELEQGEPTGGPIKVRVSGNDMDMLYEASEIIKTELTKIEGTVNIEDDYSDKTFEFYADIDEKKTGVLGITKYDVLKEVNIALRGKTASVLRKDGTECNIVVDSTISSKEELENLKIKSGATGNKVLLKDISDISLNRRTTRIKRYQKERVINIGSEVRPGYSPVDIEKELQEKLSALDIGGVRVEYDGEKAKINRSFGDIGNSAIFAFLVIFGILLLQFNSFTQPLIILLTVPMSVIGSIIGLALTSKPLSFTSILGIVSLMGIVVNNAIVLIDYINSEKANGHNIEEACLQAVSKRFRPIMLTTATTVIGLIPLILTGDEMFTPMSIALLSGLIMSTLLTLVIIPIVYSIIETK